ncbi:3-methylornithine--L-lysine ligase PylC [Methanohalophilus sp.]|uniref:3-methylornithine--L-lysine ligase PylC n=1 Tax=Methanohalophilus sp. TaxID=1966352 RepID=UPI00260D09F4|nr:3-methylornithine--L-lysine ligase PylC [Methanohalophilus sp.]MDK2891649.1 3-methylornithine--L-lysine ligase [Methanohalophilus sp.]
MNTICLIGGKLQGFEVAYLAHKAGMEVVLVDKNPRALIRNVVDYTFCFDITKEPSRLIELSREVSAIIPTNENLDTLLFLKRIVQELECPLLFDFEAYHVSMDKKRSKEYFASIGVPTPCDKPSKPPYFVKPPCMSSSIGARIIETEEELAQIGPEMLVEEYLTGSVISLEVVGYGDKYAIGQQTQVHIDDVYDCYKVTPMNTDEEFRDISYRLASNLNLKGIMDVEAIASPSGIRVIEIDARFPSQTPTVVYHSSGINLLTWLMDAFCAKVPDVKPQILKHCIYEHLMVNGKSLRPTGEHLFSEGEDYFPLFEGDNIEIFKSTGKHTIYTLICTGYSSKQVENVHNEAIKIIRKDMDK